MSALSASADTLSSTSGQHPRNDILSVFGSFGESPLSSSAPSIRRSQNLVKSLCLSRRSLFSNTFVAHRFNLGDIVVINQPTSCGLKVKPGSVGRVVCIDRRAGAVEASYKVEFAGIECLNWQVDLWWKESQLNSVKAETTQQKENVEQQ
jgi:hypothetical protein